MSIDYTCLLLCAAAAVVSIGLMALLAVRAARRLGSSRPVTPT